MKDMCVTQLALNLDATTPTTEPRPQLKRRLTLTPVWSACSWVVTLNFSRSAGKCFAIFSSSSLARGRHRSCRPEAGQGEDEMFAEA